MGYIQSQITELILLQLKNDTYYALPERALTFNNMLNTAADLIRL